MIPRLHLLLATTREQNLISAVCLGLGVSFGKVAAAVVIRDCHPKRGEAQAGTVECSKDREITWIRVSFLALFPYIPVVSVKKLTSLQYHTLTIESDCKLSHKETFSSTKNQPCYCGLSTGLNKAAQAGSTRHAVTTKV